VLLLALAGIMNNHEELKYEHEKAVCENLLKALQINLVFIRHGDDKGEPDIIFSNSENKTLGIEVATAYYNDIAAKAAWEMARGERPDGYSSWEEWDSAANSEPDEKILRRIQLEINDKCEKLYRGTDEIWLCISSQNPLSTPDSVKEYKERLYIPDRHNFVRIYVLDWVEGVDFSASRLY
jgi:hypothetical protein